VGLCVKVFRATVFLFGPAIVRFTSCFFFWLLQFVFFSGLGAPLPKIALRPTSIHLPSLGTLPTSLPQEKKLPLLNSEFSTLYSRTESIASLSSSRRFPSRSNLFLNRHIFLFSINGSSSSGLRFDA